MIEQDIQAYFLADTTLSGLIKNNQIFIVEAPSVHPATNKPPEMPWIVIEVTSGPRTKISQTKMEETAYARITVDASPAQVYKGRMIIQQCQALLENYRGNLKSAKDVHISTGAIRDWAGYSGAYRYQFDATVRHTEQFTQPVAVDL